MAKAGGSRPLAPEDAVEVIGLGAFLGLGRRQRQHSIVLDMDVRHHIERGGDAEERIETDVEWSGPQGFREIGFCVMPQAPMPFADRGCRVSLVFEQASQRQPSFFNEGG
jgi:hypothetical protein